MKKIYEKYKYKLIKLPNNVTGILVGFTNNSFLLAIDDISEISCFTLEELGKDFYYIEPEYLENNENDLLLLCYCDESQIIKYLNGKKKTQNTELLS